MAITHTFKGGRDSYGYGYFAYIEDGKLVIGESWPREGGVIYRGNYLGAVRVLELLKVEAVALYNSIEKYFTKHDVYDADCLHTKHIKDKVCDLEPGDKFKYEDVEYLLIDFKPFECFIGTADRSALCAVDLTTYKVILVNSDWEVERTN